MKPIYNDHVRVDERSLAMHRLIAGKVLAEPVLLDRARATLSRWRRAEGSPPLTLFEWEVVLRGSPTQIAQFLVDPSEAATRLRQSSPFTAILTDAERRQIYESYSTRTYRPGRQPDLR